MKFKIDENLPAAFAAELRGAGHEADTVRDEGLEGAADDVVLATCDREVRVLVTEDLDFANVVAYPPERHQGIVVMRTRQQGLGALRVSPARAAQPGWFAHRKAVDRGGRPSPRSCFSGTVSPTTRDLLARAMELSGQERGQVFDERRLRSAEEQDPGTWRTADEVFADLRQQLEERRIGRADSPPPRREPRVTGRAGDVAGAACELPPPERASLAHAILETIERCDQPDERERS